MARSAVLSCPSIPFDCGFGAHRPGHRAERGQEAAEASGLPTCLRQSRQKAGHLCPSSGWPRRARPTAVDEVGPWPGWPLGPRPRQRCTGRRDRASHGADPGSLPRVSLALAHPPWWEVSAPDRPPWKHWLNRCGAVCPWGRHPASGSAVA